MFYNESTGIRVKVTPFLLQSVYMIAKIYAISCVTCARHLSWKTVFASKPKLIDVLIRPLVCPLCAATLRAGERVMASHPPIGGVRPALNDRLRENYVGTVRLKLKNVTIPASRPMQQNGLALISDSMDATKGFVDIHAPLVVVSAADLPDGELTDRTAENLTMRILDGAHRVAVLMKRYGREALFPFRVYREFSPIDEKIIANGE